VTFLHPAYFLALLGLLPLIAVYLLKVRPTRKSVTALFLWQAVLDQKKNTALFNRLRDLLSLLLMILALLAIVLAMTAPEMGSDQRKDLLLVIDNSASMNAIEDDRSRLNAAKRIASDIIRGLNTNQQAAVATVSMDMQYQSHFTTSPKTLMDAIRNIEPSDCPFRPAALDTLAAGAPSMDDCRMILIGDGCRFVVDANHPIELIKIGSDQENVGFLTCDLHRLQGQPMRVGLYYKLASCFAEEVTTDIVVTYGADNRIIKVIPVTIQPGINDSEVVTLEGGAPGPWRATLELPDALARDNVAFLGLQVRPPVKVRVESDHPFFLINSVKAFARTSGDLQHVQDHADVVLADSRVPQADRAMIFGIPENAGWCGQSGAEVDEVLARVRIEDHPVLAQCDIDSVPFLGARKVAPPEDSLVIVETAAHVPLIYRVRRGSRSALVINMDPVQSEFYYSAWFPVLVYNGARHLMGRQETLPAACAVGDSVPIPTASDGAETTTVTVGDSEDSLQWNGSSYGPIRQAGFHTLENASGRWLLGANLFAASETLLNNHDVTDTSQPLSRGRPLTLILAIVASWLLLIECILYHRRKVG